MLKGEKVPTYGFDQIVFHKELEDVRERLIARVDGEDAIPRGEGLPDFAAHLNPDTPISNILLKVIGDLEDADNEARWQADPSAPHKGLIGLAFSGGGIRSATYNLGVMQALKKLGLFKCVDYLSTVSGGGYIGSCISSTLASINKPAYADTLHEPLNQIFDHTRGIPEPNIFRHLRNNATYLAPDGFLDFLRIPVLLLRGTVVNILVILPYILVAAIVTILVHKEAGLDHTVFGPVMGEGVESILGAYFVLTKLLLIFLALMFSLYPLIHMAGQRWTMSLDSNWDLRNLFGKFIGLFVASIIVVFFIELQPVAIKFFDSGMGKLTQIALPSVSGVVGMLLTLFAEKLMPKVSRLYGRAAFYALGIFGFVVFWMIYLYLSARGLETSEGKTVWGVSQHVVLLWYAGIAAGLWLYTFFTVDVNFTGIHKFYRDRLSKAYIVGLKQPQDTLFTDESLSAYDIVHTDNVKLSELNTRHGPYHLINALINLNRTEQKYQTGRHGDFFIFSKKYIGGDTTGYCETAEMEAISRHIDLATAMAISGAAAAPNMGKVTIKPLIFILAMLNVRLNYWLPNPARLWRKPETMLLNRMPSGLASRVGPFFLLKELFGLNGVKDRYVNLSDGGHIENLGAYELIRRQCRLIIIGDGEGDSALKFQGLAELIRMVQIDMGIKIEIDGLDYIRRGEQHHAIGTIHYPNGRIGKLIYLKSSLLGDNNLMATLEKENYITSPYRDDNLMFDENAFIAYYKALNKAFPHQSTGDQFFDEAQFECYRALGYAVTMDTLRARR